MSIYHILLIGVLVNILIYLGTVIYKRKSIQELCEERAKEKGHPPILNKDVLNLSIAITCMIPYSVLFATVYDLFFKFEKEK